MSITEMMGKLRLSGMLSAYEEHSKMPGVAELSFDERIRMMLEHELFCRDDKQMKLLLKTARFRFPGACIEDISYKTGRGITKQMMLDLNGNQWVHQKRNIIITGATGVGKTYVACALGNSACRAGIKTLYYRLPILLQEMKVARADGSYLRLLERLSRIHLLIIDDWGIYALNELERRDFLEVMEDRYSARSTVIATQMPVDKWHDIIGDPTIADAICDRLVHNAEHIQLTGESIRKTKGKDDLC